MGLHVLGTEMTLSSEHHLHVLGGGIEDWWEVGGSHDGRLISILLGTVCKEEYQSTAVVLTGMERVNEEKRSKNQSSRRSKFRLFGILGGVALFLCVTNH